MYRIRKNLSLSEEQLGQGHRINVLAILVHTHVAGSDFVNEHNLALSIVAIFELDIIEHEALLLQVISYDLGNFLGHFLDVLILLFGHHAQNNQSILGNQGIAQLVVLKGGLNICGQISALFNILAIATEEAAHSLMTANNL